MGQIKVRGNVVEDDIRELKQATTATATRRRHQTNGLMSKTIAVHVHYNSMYIS